MVTIYSRADFENEKEKVLKQIEDGAVFLYPTDTIYGIGCDASHPGLVTKIKLLKGRSEKPVSVIAPSKDWIKQNCVVHDKALDWVENKLPGPYTLILKLKNKDVIAEGVNNGMDTLGVRIPDHWFCATVAELGLPIVTTSVNLADKPPMTSMDNLEPSIKEHVDFIIYDGKLTGKASTLVDLSVEGKEKIIKR